MRKLCFLTLLLMGAFISVNAQSGPLNDYLGKYIFAEGSPVAEVSLTIEDSSLIINSAMGSSSLEKKGVDSFYLATYDALVIFKRKEGKSVESVSIFVQGMELVGKKEAGAMALKEDEFFVTFWDKHQN
ncbi:MAG: hypothetical protein KAZ20_01535 [Sediminibacterium sp.]|nr:hypothetical protein [Sediminibacterium sp.]